MLGLLPPFLGLCPSIETIRSPGCRTFAAGVLAWIESTVSVVGLSVPSARKNSTKNAISRFITGPAAITATRFQTGWL